MTVAISLPCTRLSTKSALAWFTAGSTGYAPDDWTVTRAPLFTG
ncbi:MAG: hypothetical protein ACXVRQ_05935 [Gaiellaceae bacterium]